MSIVTGTNDYRLALFAPPTLSAWIAFKAETHSARIGVFVGANGGLFCFFRAYDKALYVG